MIEPSSTPRRYKNIFWLQITMYDTGIFHGKQRMQDLRNQAQITGYEIVYG